MSDLERLERALAPVLDLVRTIDMTDLCATDTLEDAFPLESAAMLELKAIVREGVAAGWLAEREKDGVRFGRVHKASEERSHSVDCVHMDQAGPGHTHPRGEIDLCFAVSGDPEFDGRPPGWTVYTPGSWHEPTVTGGAMDILYFLPGGSIVFEAKPPRTE